MAESIMVTNEDVLRFYADKFADEEHCPMTAKYLSKLKSNGESLHGPYAGMAKRFKMGFAEKEGKDKEFYDWLKENEISSIRSFSFFQPDVFLEHTEDYYDVALQKWHLYVSWYAYCESGKLPDKKLDNEQLNESASSKPNGILNDTIICRELLLWMCEAAGSKKTKELYNALIDYETKGGNANTWLRSWAVEVKGEIKRIIGESKQNS